MDLENITPESISADKQANIALQAQVTVAARANNQTKIAGQIIEAAVRTPEPGKGGLLNTVA